MYTKRGQACTADTQEKEKKTQSQLCDIILPDVREATWLFFVSIAQISSSLLKPFANVMSVQAMQACRCYWKTPSK